MIFAPDLNPNTFLFFFYRGDTGNSWSIRDYSTFGVTPAPRYAQEFGISVDELWSKVHHNFDAPTHPTNDLDFWHRHTVDLNRRFLGVRATTADPAPLVRPQAVPPHPAAYPILDRDQFERHPKARKSQDRERILFSKISEDWVTWSAFALLERSAPATWWQILVESARADNPSLNLPPSWEEKPRLQLWQTVPSPRMYQKRSRERMRLSNDPVWIARSQDPRPVEGESEIDVSLRNNALTIFAEAKLSSDISLRTTYDPQRNQILRNIDCLLDNTEGRVPMFWMIVRDRSPSRLYTRLIEQYRTDPHALAAGLPHQDGGRLAEVGRNMSLILWSDFLPQAIQIGADDYDEELAAVKKELRSRVQ